MASRRTGGGTGYGQGYGQHRAPGGYAAGVQEQQGGHHAQQQQQYGYADALAQQTQQEQMASYGSYQQPAAAVATGGTAGYGTGAQQSIVAFQQGAYGTYQTVGGGDQQGRGQAMQASLASDQQSKLALIISQASSMASVQQTGAAQTTGASQAAYGAFSVNLQQAGLAAPAGSYGQQSGYDITAINAAATATVAIKQTPAMGYGGQQANTAAYGQQNYVGQQATAGSYGSAQQVASFDVQQAAATGFGAQQVSAGSYVAQQHEAAASTGYGAQPSTGTAYGGAMAQKPQGQYGQQQAAAAAPMYGGQAGILQAYSTSVDMRQVAGEHSALSQQQDYGAQALQASRTNYQQPYIQSAAAGDYGGSQAGTAGTGYGAKQPPAAAAATGYGQPQARASAAMAGYGAPASAGAYGGGSGSARGVVSQAQSSRPLYGEVQPAGYAGSTRGAKAGQKVATAQSYGGAQGAYGQAAVKPMAPTVKPVMNTAVPASGYGQTPPYQQPRPSYHGAHVTGPVSTPSSSFRAAVTGGAPVAGAYAKVGSSFGGKFVPEGTALARSTIKSAAAGPVSRVHIGQSASAFPDLSLSKGQAYERRGDQEKGSSGGRSRYCTTDRMQESSRSSRDSRDRAPLSLKSRERNPASGPAVDSSDVYRVEGRDRETDRQLRSRLDARPAASPRPHRNRAPSPICISPEYGVHVSSHSFVSPMQEYADLAKRYPHLVISPDFSRMISKWTADTSGVDTLGSQLLTMDKAAHFDIDVDSLLSVEVVKPVNEGGAARYNAKVLLCAGLDAAAQQALTQGAGNGGEHLHKLLKFLTVRSERDGKRGGIMCLGGHVDPALDGKVTPECALPLMNRVEILDRERQIPSRSLPP